MTTRLQAIGSGLITTMLALTVTWQVHAEDDDLAPRTAFKVCADPNEMPFSNQKQEGFENKIAKLFADDLGLPLAFEWFPQRRGFIRHTLKDNDTPDDKYKCDIVISIPEGFDMAANTKVWYHSAWALVYIKGRGLDDIKSQDDLINLPPERKKTIRLGLEMAGGPIDWAHKHDLIQNMVSYQRTAADLDETPEQIITHGLVQNKFDATFVFGPVAGWAKRKLKEQNLDLVVIPMHSEGKLKFDFRFVMGVRYGEKDWKQQINALIDKHREDIHKILASYDVPLIEDDSAEAAAKPGDHDKHDTK